MRVLILGCGPAGVFAAQGAYAGSSYMADIIIVSKNRKSEMFGAQFLHEPIPFTSDMAEEPSTPLRYSLLGSPDIYRKKVYGENWRGEVSPHLFEGEIPVWSIRRYYDVGWDIWSRAIEDHTFTSPAEVADLLDLVKADVVFSTIPAPTLCVGNHTFSSVSAWAVGDAPERGVYSPVRVVGDQEVLCDGTMDRAWYRNASVFGYVTTEWPFEKSPPFSGVSEFTKPLSNNCTCFPEIIRLGRYGKWKKGALAHQAYSEAYSVLWKGYESDYRDFQGLLW